MSDMGAIIDILKSERGFIGLGLIVCATVLTALHIMPVEQWTQYTQVVFAAYALSKGASSVAEALSTRRAATVASPTTPTGGAA